MTNDPGKIFPAFSTGSRMASIRPLGSGHINETYLVTTFPEGSPGYVLQRINHHIFKDITALTNNILEVTSHVRRRLATAGEEIKHFRIPCLMRSEAGEYYHRDEVGNFWRLFEFIEESISFDTVPSTALAKEGGRAFGIFQELTSDLDARKLKEILPDFHDISVRLKTFREIAEKDPVSRSAEAEPLIRFVEKRAAEMHRIRELGRQGLIPLRVTHNDTKFNNILFDSSGRAISVVDLDTVMPGYILYDFGDAIRTGASMAAEDEPDTGKAGISLDLFEAYAEGYLSVAREFLLPEEKENLAFSALFMTYIIGLRFLTDHLDGDKYYKVAFPGHNLQRARAQFALLADMEAKYDRMNSLIHGLW